MKRKDIIKKISRAWKPAACMLALTLCVSCGDLDLVPEGETTLDKTADLELLLNRKTIRSNPNENLGILVNEDYGCDFSTVKTRLRNKETLTYAYLAYDESVDRALLSTKDYCYTNIYEYVNYMNVLLSKIGSSRGNEQQKPALIAEAKISRAYYLFLAANIYAAQYDAATVAEQNGIAYPTDANVDQKPQLPLQQCYDMMLSDCSDENIALLPTRGNVSRITRCGGNAVRALILFQMKKYDEALTYASKALELNSQIEDRSVIKTTSRWELKPSSSNNILYVSPLYDMNEYPNCEQLSWETAALFEPGDYVKDYAQSSDAPYWDPDYGEMDSGIEGCLEAYGDAYCNPWGITVEQMMYLAAECKIRTGHVQDGLDLVNKVRTFRIDPDYYTPFAATGEQEAMALLQKAKFIECIGSYVNFFDRRRWNTENAYKKTIIRDLRDLGQYSIAPDSKLWVQPFPVRVMQNNPTFRQNY